MNNQFTILNNLFKILIVQEMYLAKRCTLQIVIAVHWNAYLRLNFNHILLYRDNRGTVDVGALWTITYIVHF